MKNSQKVQNKDVLISNSANKSWYVSQMSDNGKMTIIPLKTDKNAECKRVSKTFANSCILYRKVDQ